MVTAKNSVRIRTRNYADWKLLKNGCRESPRGDDSDSDDAFEPDEVIIEGPEQHLIYFVYLFIFVCCFRSHRCVPST